ncbi:hypothetical protein SAMN05660909_03543 [Chitinophaga terrae (ex Kim and Jung 2007)]|uniref:Uncharacterized protein n=1 Tax=Chitinophaga terrae (ex Kim and Jung 2007) TaxID=408074 RepID=A0A1H4E733_9BACT|nr:hypothetical protein [Chitinophaga terrae (ex Kim and Jung 2007)]SEA80548.1 hypothetical protein SAMN05660909_03543 [Chitinophaga terrae (ex Kim and Jung 2007)]
MDIFLKCISSNAPIISKKTPHIMKSRANQAKNLPVKNRIQQPECGLIVGILGSNSLLFSCSQQPYFPLHKMLIAIH